MRVKLKKLLFLGVFSNLTRIQSFKKFFCSVITGYILYLEGLRRVNHLKNRKYHIGHLSKKIKANVVFEIIRLKQLFHR